MRSTAIGRTRTETRVDASARRGPRGRWAGRRLLRAGARGDADARDGAVRIARTSGHRLRERAKRAIAAWWADTREPALRQAVLDTGAVAAKRLPRLLTLALHDRLGEWRGSDARRAPALLADDDPDVRGRTAETCRNATGPIHRALWAADTGPGTPLRNVLLENADPPPAERTLNALWKAWLDEPTGGLGDALVRWGQPATAGRIVRLTAVVVETDRDVLREPPYREVLLDALDHRDHPLSDIAAGKIAGLGDQALVEEVCERALTRPDLAALCARHKLAPRDPVKRVVFYLRTGQPRAREALDPDGSLLSLAYASASAAERGHVRQAMLTAGELDLVQVIVGDDRRARIATMPEGEVRYLAERLAERREWDDLWAFVQDLPIAHGIALARLFDGWAPRDADARRVFEMFRRSDPEAIDRGTQEVRKSTPTAFHQARLHFHGRVGDVSFSPNRRGAFLAVVTSEAAGLFDLRAARLVQRYDGFGGDVGTVLHVGDGAFIAGEHGGGPARLVRCAGGRIDTLHTGPGAVTSLALTGDDGSFAAGTRDGLLLLGRPGGRIERRRLPDSGGERQAPRTIAAHRPSGRIAVLGHELYVTGPDTGLTADPAADPAESITQLAFVDADTLVYATRQGVLVRKRLGPSGAEDAARVPAQSMTRLAVLPRTGDPVVLGQRGFLYFHDAATLRIHATAMLTGTGTGRPSGGSPTSMTISPDGDFFAVGDAAGHTDLYDMRLRELPDLLRRPLVDLVPRDLGIVGAALTDPRVSPQGTAALRLIEACLEYRFRFDIEIGDAVRLAGGEHDISL